MKHPQTDPPPPPPATTDAAPSAPRRQALESRVLFAGGSEVVIFHYGESYRLRQTRQGKLILTK